MLFRLRVSSAFYLSEFRHEMKGWKLEFYLWNKLASVFIVMAEYNRHSWSMQCICCVCSKASLKFGSWIERVSNEYVQSQNSKGWLKKGLYLWLGRLSSHSHFLCWTTPTWMASRGYIVHVHELSFISNVTFICNYNLCSALWEHYLPQTFPSSQIHAFIDFPQDPLHTWALEYDLVRQ
jgi:hypothetical protein